MADRKILVLKSRLNPTKIKLLGEKLKGKMFAKSLFLKPKLGEIRLVSVDKYFEPFIVIGGKYAIDYCKKRVHTIKVDGDAREVAFFDRKFKPDPSSSSIQNKVINFDFEAYFHYENEACFILDEMGREIDPKQLSYALGYGVADSGEPPSKKVARMKLPEVKISREEKIEFLQSRIAKKPSDVGEVIKEIFEVNKRDIVYRPMYQLTFQNLKTGKKAIANIDSISGKVFLGESNKTIDLPYIEGELVVGEKKDIDSYCYVVGNVEIPSETTMFENLVVKGHLKIGTDCQILGKVQALRDIVIGANTTIDGNVVSGRNVVVGPNSVIYGSIESAGDVEICEKAVIEGDLHPKSSVILNQFAGWTEKP